MTFFLVPIGRQHAIGSTSPLIKASEYDAFSTAVDLLAAVDELSVNAEASARARADAAYEEGYAKGIADAQSKLSDVIAELTLRVTRQSDERRNDIADAAIGATRAIIGTFENTEVLRRLVLQALERVDNSAPIIIEVNPEMAASLVQTVDVDSNIKIVAVDDLAPLDCVFRMPKGRILAGLELQMTALAERWGSEQRYTEAELA